MVNPTVFFDITADDEPLGRVSFEVGWAVVLQGGVPGAVEGEALSGAARPSGGASAGGGAIS
jgi:hypothetical protein